ncbi:MAG: hypothetical protein KKF65_07440 [Nanoarchaeota archaeon]|nr:hypothetical protein [Nanoarchaeota archaeon]
MKKKKRVNLLNLDKKIWISKPYRRIPFANERISYTLSKIFSFNNVRVPHPNNIEYKDQKYQLSEYIQSASSLKSEGIIPLLPTEGVNGLILKLIMSDIDGNWQNILINGKETWLIDFEYSGHFYKFEDRFLKRNSKITWSLLSGFLGDSPDLGVLSQGVNNVKMAVSLGKISIPKLMIVAKESGFLDDEVEYTAQNIFKNAETIDNKVDHCLSEWASLDFYEKNKEPSIQFFPFEITNGARCGPSCIRLTLDYFGHKKPSFEQLDSELGRRDSQYTHLVQIANYFINRNFKVKYFLNEKSAIRFIKGEDKQVYNEFRPESALYIRRFTNYQEVKYALESILEKKKYSTKNPSISFLEDIYYRDCVIICSLDNSVIYHQDGYLRAHHVIVTGFSSDAVFYHNVGPKNAKQDSKVPKEMFKKAVEKTHLLDYSTLVILPP